MPVTLIKGVSYPTIEQPQTGPVVQDFLVEVSSASNQILLMSGSNLLLVQ